MRALPVTVAALLAGASLAVLAAGGAGAQDDGPYYDIPAGPVTTTQTTGPQAPVTTGTQTTPSAPGATTRPRPTRLTLSLTTARDRRSPYRATASGRLSRPSSVTAATGCKGKVAVRVKRGSAIVFSKRAAVSSSCRFKQAFTVPRRGRHTVTARFEGVAALKPRSATSRAFRAG